MARIALMSRTQPSIRAPADPRTFDAVLSNSPQGAMRAGFDLAMEGLAAR